MKERIKNLFKEWWYVLAIILLFVLSQKFVFSQIEVDGPSMDPHVKRMYLF
jgi:signal peptidase I